MTEQNESNDERVNQMKKSIDQIATKEMILMQEALTQFDTFCIAYPEYANSYGHEKDKKSINFSKSKTYLVRAKFGESLEWKTEFPTPDKYTAKALTMQADSAVRNTIGAYLSLITEATASMRTKIDERVKTYTDLANSVTGSKTN